MDKHSFQLNLQQIQLLLSKHSVEFKIFNIDKLQTDTFSGLAYDSQVVVRNDIFISKSKDQDKALDYIQMAQDKGTELVIASFDVKLSDITYIDVDDIDLTLAILSAELFQHPERELKIVGITGTKGKTSTAYMTHAILQSATNNKTALFSTIDTVLGPKDYDRQKSKLTTPESYDLFANMRQAIDNGMTHLVMEVSSQAFLRKRVAGITYDAAAFLNISNDHVGINEHPTFEDYLAHKLMIFENTKTAVINFETDYYDKVIQSAQAHLTSDQIIMYGPFRSTDEIDVQYHIDISTIANSTFSIKDEQLNLDEQDVEVNLPGEFNVANAAAAIALAKIVNPRVNRHDIDQLASLAIPGRMLVFKTNNSPMVLVDYAHNGDALKNLLKFVKRHIGSHDYLLILGATGDKGENRRHDFAEVINEYQPQVILTTDDPGHEDPNKIANEIAEQLQPEINYQIILDRESAIKTAIKNAGKEDIIIVAGKGDDHYQKINGVNVAYPGDTKIVKNLLQ